MAFPAYPPNAYANGYANNKFMMKRVGRHDIRVHNKMKHSVYIIVTQNEKTAMLDKAIDMFKNAGKTGFDLFKTEGLGLLYPLIGDLKKDKKSAQALADGGIGEWQVIEGGDKHDWSIHESWVEKLAGGEVDITFTDFKYNKKATLTFKG
eukprot:408995_1